MHETTLRTGLRAAFIAAMLLAFVAALLPPPNAPALIEGQDKLGHFAVFLVLGLIGLSAWPARAARVIGILLLYGVAMELAQSFTDHRYGDPWDWLADAAGVATAVILNRIWQKPSYTAPVQSRSEAAQAKP